MCRKICELLECDVSIGRGSTPTLFNKFVTFATTSAITVVVDIFCPVATGFVATVLGGVVTDIKSTWEQIKCIFYLLGRLVVPAFIAYFNLCTG